MKRFATLGLIVLLGAATGGLGGYSLARTTGADTPECCKNKESCCPGSQCCPKEEHRPAHRAISV